MHRCVCLVKAHLMLWFLTLWGQFQNLTSGQGQVVTQKGHAAYVSTRLGETNTLVVVSCLYVDYVESYSQKSDGDPGWPQMTPKGYRAFFCLNRQYYHIWSLSKCNWVDLHEKQCFWKFLHWLIIGRSRNWPDPRSPIPKFWDKRFVATDDLTPPWKFSIDSSKTVVMALP